MQIKGLAFDENAIITMEEFGSYLLANDIVQPAQLQQIAKIDPAAAGAVGAVPIYYRLLKDFPEREDAVWQGLADFLQLDLIDVDRLKIDTSLSRILPARLAHEYAIAPIACRQNRVDIALADPAQFDKCSEYSMLISELPGGEFSAGVTVIPHLAKPRDVAEIIRLVYGIGADSVQEVLEEQLDEYVIEETAGYESTEVVDLTKAQGPGADVAIIRFVNQLLLEAVKIGASDIHLEPFEEKLRVRYRLDGMLQTEPVPERIKHLEAAIISRLKIMANLDIAEKRLPQDGQIRLSMMGRPIDVRVSVLPTMFGQGLALRLLDKQLTFRQLGNLGIPDDYLRLFREVLRLSHGVVLVTGPTGSGKTTTLYASLNELNSPERKIITVEDPIEYQLEGISQIQVKPAIGLGFSTILRHILRHDPDIVMIGEIRDVETARIAISAAMTGHLVFSTLHTNDASSAPVRLLEMGLEPYLVSSALEAVIAQRLVRMQCRQCREPVQETEGFPADEMELIRSGCVFYNSKGCPACRHTGYQGRTAIFEMFSLNDEIRQLVLKRANAAEICQAATRLGMRTLRQSGLEKVRAGVSSLAEVYRVTREEMVDMRGVMGDESD